MKEHSPTFHDLTPKRVTSSRICSSSSLLQGTYAKHGTSTPKDQTATTKLDSTAGMDSHWDPQATRQEAQAHLRAQMSTKSNIVPWCRSQSCLPLRHARRLRSHCSACCPSCVSPPWTRRSTLCTPTPRLHTCTVINQTATYSRSRSCGDDDSKFQNNFPSCILVGLALARSRDLARACAA